MDGSKVKMLREDKGVSQREVAIATGLTETTLYSIENGKADNPTSKTIKAIANFYDVEVSELIDDK